MAEPISARRTRILALLAAAVAMSGCAHLNYRLEPLGRDVLVIPPKAQPVPGDPSAFRVPFPGMSTAAPCSFVTPGYTGHAQPGGLVVSAASGAGEPTVAAVPLTPGAVMLGKQTPVSHLHSLDELRAALDTAQAAGCFGKAAGEARTRIEQDLPWASDDVSALASGDPAGEDYFPLHAGQRLRVTTPLLNAAGDWAGAANLLYDLAPRAHGQVALVLARTTVKPGLHPQMLDLPPAPAAIFWRLIVFGRSGAQFQINDLVGAPNLAAMRAATAAIENDPRQCDALRRTMICVAPRYGTVINPELRVWVEDRWLALPIGSTVDRAIGERLGASPQLARPAAYRVQRPYGKKLINVAAPPDSLARLVLLGGERITWRR
ncbi:MAG TPA: hypothetical protein VN515_03315 [Terriglobales bacterium]|nr:hypothetical protein [Terriglobales bacterium]